jgi:hypothetical protein
MSITLAFAVSQGSLYFKITLLQFRLGSLFNTFYVCLIQSQPFHKSLCCSACWACQPNLPT